MVAELDAKPTHSDPPKKYRRSLNRGSLLQRAKARTLYIVEQLPYKDIEEATGIPVKSLHNLAHRERWVDSRKRVRERVTEKSLARIKGQVEEVIEAVALQTEELSLGTLAKAADTLDRTDVNAARDLQAYSQAAKNFVGIARQARGLDIEQQGERQGALVVFLGDLPRVSRQSDPINVTPTSPALPSPSPKEAPVSSDGVEGAALPMD